MGYEKRRSLIKPKNTIPNAKHRCGSIMLEGGFDALHSIDDIMRTEKFLENIYATFQDKGLEDLRQFMFTWITCQVLLRKKEKVSMHLHRSL